MAEIIEIRVQDGTGRTANSSATPPRPPGSSMLTQPATPPVGPPPVPPPSGGRRTAVVGTAFDEPEKAGGGDRTAATDSLPKSLAGAFDSFRSHADGLARHVTDSWERHGQTLKAEHDAWLRHVKEQHDEQKRLLEDEARERKHFWERLLPQRIHAVARPASQIAAGDPAGAAQSALAMVPRFGNALGAAVSGLRAFNAGLNQTINKFAPFSGTLSVAQAQANIAQLQGDIRRAQMIGPELAEFVKSRSELAQAGQDLLVRILKPIVPILTDIMKVIKDIADGWVGQGLGFISEGVGAFYDLSKTGLSILGGIDSLNEAVEEFEDKYFRNRGASNDGGRDFLRRFVESNERPFLRPPLVPRFEPDNRLRMPIFGGGV